MGDSLHEYRKLYGKTLSLVKEYRNAVDKTTTYFSDLRVVIAEKLTELQSYRWGATAFLQDDSIIYGSEVFSKSEDRKLLKNFATLMPEWGGYGYNLAHTGRSMFTGTNTGVISGQYLTNTLVSGSGDITSGIAIGPNGSMYFGTSNGYLIYMNPDGSINTSDSFSSGSPVIGTPAISPDGTIYVGCQNGHVYSIPPDLDGYNWQYNTGGSINNSSPIIGSDETIYIGSSAGVFALYKSGTLRWSYICPVDYSSPAIGNNEIIYIGGTNGTLYALHPDGTALFAIQLDAPLMCSPSIGSDGTVYIASLAGTVYSINGLTGDILGKGQCGSEITSSPAIGANGDIYIACTDNTVSAFGKTFNLPKNIIWTYPIGSIIGTPVQDSSGNIYLNHNNEIYKGTQYEFTKISSTYYCNSSPVLSPNFQYVYVATTSGVIQITIADGTILPFVGYSGYYYGNPSQNSNNVVLEPFVDASNNVYFGGTDKVIYCFDVVGNLLWGCYTDTGSAISSTPSLGPGQLYVATSNGVSDDNARLYVLDTATETTHNCSQVTGHDVQNYLTFTDTSGIQELQSLRLDHTIFPTGSSIQGSTTYYVSQGYSTTSFTPVSIENISASGSDLNANEIFVVVADTTIFTTYPWSGPGVIFTISETTNFNTTFTVVSIAGTTIRFLCTDEFVDFSSYPSETTGVINSLITGGPVPLSMTPDGLTPCTELSNGTFDPTHNVVFKTVSIPQKLDYNVATTVLSTGSNNEYAIIFGTLDGTIVFLKSDMTTINNVFEDGYGEFRTNPVSFYDSGNFGDYYYFGDNDGNIISLLLAGSGSNSLIWSVNIENIVNRSISVSSDGLILYCASNSAVYKFTNITEQNPTPVSYTLFPITNVECSPCVDITNNDNVLMGSATGISSINVVGSSTPSKWSVGVPNNNKFDSPAIGADGTIYVGTGSGMGFAGSIFRLSPTDGTLLTQWSNTNEDSNMWSPVIGSNGTVYAASDSGISAFI